MTPITVIVIVVRYPKKETLNFKGGSCHASNRHDLSTTRATDNLIHSTIPPDGIRKLEMAATDPWRTVNTSSRSSRKLRIYCALPREFNFYAAGGPVDNNLICIVSLD